MQRICFVTLFAVAASFLSDPVNAQQGQAAMLVGTVRDGSGAVLGRAAITVVSPALIGGPRTATTDQQGLYRLPQLLPGSYEITATATGFRSATRPSVLLTAGATVTVDLALEVDGISESVQVNGSSPVDVHTTASVTVIPRDVLDNLPLNRLVASGFVNLAPGVIKNTAFGSSASANPFFLDGANGNEPGWGTPTVIPSASWIEDLQIVSAGADARYGEFTGALSNAITRSGSNRFAGTGELWTTEQSWVSNNRGALPADLASRFVPLKVYERWTSIGQLGGPLKKDTLWFFGGVDYYRNANRPGGFSSAAEAPNETRYVVDEPKMFGKISAAPHAGVLLDGSIARDLSNSSGANAGPLTKPEALTIGRYDETLWNVRLMWPLSSRTLLEARHGGHQLDNDSGPSTDAGRAGPAPHSDNITGIRSVNAPSYFKGSNSALTTSAELSHYIDGSRQHHNLRLGYEFESASLYSESGFPGGMLFSDAAGVPDQVYITDASIYRPSHHRHTMYAQDAWDVLPRLTVNAGARIGFYSGGVRGMGTQFSSSAISPRLGFAWDVRADHSLALRAHYGRYHEAMVTSFYDFLDPLSQPTFIDAKVIGPNQFSEIYRTVANGRFGVNPDLTYPYVDEELVGLERAVSANGSVTAQVIHRRFGGIVGFIDTGSVWSPVPIQDPGPDGAIGTADDGKMLTLYANNDPYLASFELTNPAGAYKHYDGVQIIATRRAAGLWQGQLSYTWSRTRASFDNAFSSNAANNDLGSNGVYVNPNRALFAAGRTSQDFTHELKAVGSLVLPRWAALRISGFYRLQSGMPWAREITPTGAFQLCCELVEPRGARVTPATNVADLRIEKTFPVHSSKVSAYVDVFNLGNQGIANRYDFRSGPTFLTPGSWSDPRVIRVGTRVMF